MALFNKTKEKEVKTETDQKKSVSSDSKLSTAENRELLILKNPRITEKASIVTDRNVYVFDVDRKANKKMIEDAVKAIYKVTPRKVRTTRIPTKKTFVRGNRGTKGGGKKAYVYLKKGDKIEVL